jgi:cytidyltransferase-like protein
MAHSVIAVYPGTFDPMTLGHEDVVRRATQLFDRVIVAVAAGHHKKAMFTLQERIEMAREVVQASTRRWRWRAFPACCAISWWRVAARPWCAACAP